MNESTQVIHQKIAKPLLPTLVDASLAIEKLRVASEIRQSHLARQGKQDPETDELHRHLKDLEDFIDGRVSELIETHPAYPWFSRVKGIGGENIAKVVAPIDIGRANTISALWKFAGLSVEEGVAPRRVKGSGKLSYNSQLRSMCYSDDTEVMTENGFKPWEEVTYNDKLATLNLITEELEYYHPFLLHKYQYEGTLIHFKGQAVDLLVTPDHNMLIRKQSGDWELVTAQEIYQGYYGAEAKRVRSPQRQIALDLRQQGLNLNQIAKTMSCSIGMVNHWVRRKVSRWGLKHNLLELKRDLVWNCSDRETYFEYPIDLWLKFLGWWIAEGSLNYKPNKHYQITIHNNSEEHRAKIASLIEQMGFNPHNYSNSKRVQFSSKKISSYLKQFGYAPDKYIPKEIKSLPPKRLKVLLGSLIDGDGYRQNNQQGYCTTSPQLASDVAEIALKSGYAVTMDKHSPRPTEKRHSNYPSHRVLITEKQKTPLVPKPQLIPYEGTVYCATVPNHTLLVKRNGKVCWSGNCWRLASSLRRARGKFYQYYIQEKDKYTERFENQGYKVLATPQGRWMCLNCGASWNKQREITPCCANPRIEKRLREEPAGVIWKGHLDAMALRKAIKLFLACLWLVWRDAEGLPVTRPYALDRLGHNSFIDPWEMTDKPSI